MKKLLSVLVICSLMTVLFGVGGITASASSDDGFIIVNYHSGKALTINCDNVEQSTLNANSCQQWHITQKGVTCDNRKYYAIENYSSGKFIEVENSSNSNYANVQQGCYTGCDNQLWYIDCCQTDDFATYYRIENKNSGKLLTLAAPYKGDGVNVEQYSYVGGSSGRDQLWALLPLYEH